MRGFLPGLIHCDQSCTYSGTIMGMGPDCIPQDPPALARSAKNIPGVLECCTARVEGEKVFLCAQEFPLEAWEAFLNIPLFWGAIMDLPLPQGGSPAQGEDAESSRRDSRGRCPRGQYLFSVPSRQTWKFRIERRFRHPFAMVAQIFR